MTQAHEDPKTQAYYKAQAKQFAADKQRREERSEGKLLYVADYAAVEAAIRRAGFAMTDDEPRGRGHGYFTDFQPADIDDLINELRGLSPETRSALIELLAMGKPT